MNATQRILVKLACSMGEEQLQEFKSLSFARPAIRESYSTPIGYLMRLKENHRTVNSFVKYLEEIFSSSSGFSNFHGIVTEHLTNCKEDDLTGIPSHRFNSESTAEQRVCFTRTMFEIKDHIIGNDLSIMTAVSPLLKSVKEHISRPLDLLEKMKERGCICENNVEYLKELLAALNLMEPRQLLLNYEARYPPIQHPPIQHPPIQYPPNFRQRPSHPPPPPTMPRGEVQYLAEGHINYTRRAGGRPHSYSLNDTHTAGSGSEDEYFTASGSPMPGQHSNSSRYQSSPLPRSASLSRFRDKLSIPYNNIYPGGTRSTKSTYLHSNTIQSHSQLQLQQLAYQNNEHSISPTLPEPSAPLLGELLSPRQHNPPLLRPQAIGGGAFCQPTVCEPNMNNHVGANSTPLSSFVGSGDGFCCQPEEVQKGPAVAIYNPHPGISNSMRSRLHYPNNPQSSLRENGTENVHVSSLCSSLQSIAARHEGRTQSESGSLIVQSSKSPPNSNILIPSVGSRMYPILSSIESSSSEEETQVRKTQVRKRKSSHTWTNMESKKLLRRENRWEDDASGVEENVPSVNTEESEEDYHTPPEGED